jgi:DNA-binding transcriptional MerR regulator
MTRARTTANPQRQPPRATASASDANETDRQIKIGEAARLIGVEAYVLRFWETQFPFLRPLHSRSKHRYYDRKSLEALRLIRRLLHSEGYTIAGAKKHIRETGLDRLTADGTTTHTAPAPAPAEPAAHDDGSTHAASARNGELSRSMQTQLTAIREELKSLHKLLAR